MSLSVCHDAFKAPYDISLDSHTYDHKQFHKMSKPQTATGEGTCHLLAIIKQVIRD